MDWLKNKFNSLLRKFEEASDENDLKKPKAKSSARAELDTFKFKNEAFELVCQYLGDNLCQMLSKEVGLTLSFNTFTQDNKRIKT